MRATTTLALTHSVAKGIAESDGTVRRDFENGTVVYNPMGNKPVSVTFGENHRSLATDKTARTHELGSADGDIFLKVKGRQDLVTVVGNTTSATAGEHVEAIGRWVVDREHGEQFKGEELETTQPASAGGIEKYLASGAIRSIGPKLGCSMIGLLYSPRCSIQ